MLTCASSSFGFRVSGFGMRVGGLGLGVGVSEFEFRVSGFGLGFRVSGSWGFGFGEMSLRVAVFGQPVET